MSKLIIERVDNYLGASYYIKDWATKKIAYRVPITLDNKPDKRFKGYSLVMKAKRNKRKHNKMIVNSIKKKRRQAKIRAWGYKFAFRSWTVALILAVLNFYVKGL